MSGRPGYSRAHYRRLSNGGPDLPGAVEERVRLRKAGEQANREMMERFAPLTAENVRAALDWQEARIKELTR